MATTARRSLWARFAHRFSQDVTGGVLMIAAAILGLAWANSPWRESYAALSAFTLGPESIHLDLSLSTWAADGLLAVFFFVVGVELKHEIVAGNLRNPRQAAVPVLAAVGGMMLPALIYVGVVLALGAPEMLHGWAIPTATDIAFALAILGIFGRGLPVELRIFLLTLAVVDDLLAIVVIAVFYTATIHLVSLIGAIAVIALFALAARARRMRWWLMIPLALVAWALMHESGVHATIAGVLLGFCIPARPLRDEVEPRTHQLEHAVKPLSAGIALPIFAFFAAGVTIVGSDAGAVLTEPVVIAVVAALVIGKLVGVLGVTALVTKVTPLRLPDRIGIRDLLPVGFLTAIGFTVSLLIAELSFGSDEEATSGAKIAILIASLLAAILAAVTLRLDARKARSSDMNEDGVVDGESPLIGDRPVED
ncbi:Na+/H+ antiporter NhaA [Microbacterium oryzae]|uniref:Na(+)/H(+) antiporter NhaA n=1 Tax=Microbacterium oryzae TaxID=743009 RepID=A0A6I6DZV3_9MICO|nr:Na+/H+ antiporter NhaA [Microbacterium oryzae]QGU27484.1 Na+/H+ antiporter NhaA [Microbacterium oryzae]